METELREPRAEKVAVVDEVRQQLTVSSAMILTEYRGLKVSELAELRRSLSVTGGKYKVYKNTLVRRAADECGFGEINSLLQGPTAITFVDGDVAAAAKVLRDFARIHPALIIKGGLVGKSIIDAKQTSALAELASREVLLAQFAAALAAPMRQFAGLLKAMPQKFAYGLSALIDSKGGVQEVPAEAATSEISGDDGDVEVQDVAHVDDVSTKSEIVDQVESKEADDGGEKGPASAGEAE